MPLPNWTRHAVPADGLTVEFGFTIQPDVYHGPDDYASSWESLSEEEHEAARLSLSEPILQPDLPLRPLHDADCAPNIVLSADAACAPLEMVAYARDVLRIYRDREVQQTELPSEFWANLVFLSNAGSIAFAWIDAWMDMWPILDALISLGDGDHIDDLDQGWFFVAVRGGDDVYLLSADPNVFGLDPTASGPDGIHTALRCDRRQLIGQIEALRARMARLLPTLHAQVGKAVWSAEAWPDRWRDHSSK